MGPKPSAFQHLSRHRAIRNSIYSIAITRMRTRLPSSSFSHFLFCSPPTCSGYARDKAGNRELFFDDYCAAVMLYLLNPLIGSMRSLQTPALGGLVDAAAAVAVIEELAGQARPLLPPRASQIGAE
jgi:hypothetical protein